MLVQLVQGTVLLPMVPLAAMAADQFLEVDRPDQHTVQVRERQPLPTLALVVLRQLITLVLL